MSLISSHMDEWHLRWLSGELTNNVNLFLSVDDLTFKHAPASAVFYGAPRALYVLHNYLTYGL
jgi:hypothetical protein